jgi:hypothetical protein
MTMQGPAARQFHTTCHSRFGYMRAVSDGRHLIRLDWDQERFAAPENPDDVSRETCRQLAAYLAGRRTFFDLPLAARGNFRSGASLAHGNGQNSLWHGGELYRVRGSRRQTAGPPCRRHRLFDKSDTDYLSLPSRRATGRGAGKLRRWQRPVAAASR